MFTLSKHLLIQGWFGGVKQSFERCLSVVALIMDMWITSGLTKSFILDSIRCIKTPVQPKPPVCDGARCESSQRFKTDMCCHRNLCLRCLVGLWMSLPHLWRSCLNHFVSIYFQQLLFKVGDGTINMTIKIIY